ncbi:MAG: ISL3 family transposase [Anaerolineae bacterium]
MLIKTVLNRVHKVKGFVYEKVRFDHDEFEVDVRPRRGSRPCCRGCGRQSSTYDHQPPRRFRFVPLWGLPVYLVYAMRRVDCRTCGPTVEMVPWAEGKSPMTRAFSWFLAVWARRLSWSEVGDIFGTNWNRVYDAVKWAVSYGLTHRNLDGITAIGVDELAYRKGHKYMTVVYQIDSHCRRLLWIGWDRTEATLRGFFIWLGEARSAALRYVCSDMWKPYLNVIREQATGALNILDRFHIMSNMNKALDEVRREEARRLREDGKDPVLKHTRWCILKRVVNLTTNQISTLCELLAMNLKTVKAYLMKEDFHQFWEYSYPANAGKFLDGWCKRVMRSRIEPMKKIARSLRAHRALILNWFAAKKQFSSGIVEGMNNKVKTTARKSYGFGTQEVLQVALYHALADLPLPPVTHRFC